MILKIQQFVLLALIYKKNAKNPKTFSKNITVFFFALFYFQNSKYFNNFIIKSSEFIINSFYSALKEMFNKFSYLPFNKFQKFVKYSLLNLEEHRILAILPLKKEELRKNRY